MAEIFYFLGLASKYFWFILRPTVNPTEKSFLNEDRGWI